MLISIAGNADFYIVVRPDNIRREQSLHEGGQNASDGDPAMKESRQDLRLMRCLVVLHRFNYDLLCLHLCCLHTLFKDHGTSEQ